MNKRIKELRNYLKLSGEEFGSKIGISKMSISNLEHGRYNLTEQSVKSICREFNVNEQWLRNGDGDMFNTISEDEELKNLVDNLFKNDKYSKLKRLLVKHLLTLSDEELQKFEDDILNYSKELQQ